MSPCIDYSLFLPPPLLAGKRIHSPEEWDSLLVEALVQCKQWTAAVTKLQQMLEKE